MTPIQSSLDEGTPRKGRSFCWSFFFHNIALLRPGLCLYGLMGLTLWLYWPGLDGPFLFDDFANLPALGEYGRIDDWQSLIRYLKEGIAGPTGRPISLLSFLLNDVSWPSEPWPFKYTNLLIHVLNGLLVCWCSLKIFRLNNHPAIRKQAEWLALASCGLWLLHPMHVATTLYVIQRMTMLAALFSLCGILLYLQGRETMQTRPKSGFALITLAAGPLTLLSVYSKESGALLPLLLAVIEYSVLRHQGLLEKRPHRLWTLLFLWIPTAAAIVYLGRFLFPYLAGAFERRGFTAFERGLTEARILISYLYHLAVPKLYSGSLFNDDYPISNGLLTPPTTLVALVIIGALLALAHRTRKTYPLLSLAVLFFFVGHLLESSIAPLDLYYEHRNYLPSVFLFMPLAYAVDKHGKLLTVMVIGLIVLMAGFTSAKARLWSNENELLLFWGRQHPDSVRAQRYASNIYFKLGQYDRSLDVLKIATDKHPDDFRLRLHRMIVGCLTYNPDDKNVSGTLQLVKNQPIYFDSQAFDMMDQLVGLTGEARCPGLKLSQLGEMTDSLLLNPAVKDSASYQYLLNHIKGLISIQEKNGTAALMHFAKALNLSEDPETGLLESALLASHGYLTEASRHLDASEKLLNSMERAVSGVLAKHDYPAEIERLRKNIKEDMANHTVQPNH